MKTKQRLYLASLSLSTWFSITSASTCNCNPCKNILTGHYAGSWNLVSETYENCGESCLYETTDGRKACFCDPGVLAYSEVCTANTTSIETLGVVLLGGIVNGVISNEATTLYPQKCRPIANLPENVTRHSSVGIEGALVSCGGVTIETLPVGQTETKTTLPSGQTERKTTHHCWKFSRKSANPLGEWNPFPNLPEPLQSFGMVVVDNFLMVLGGNTQPGDAEPTPSDRRKRRDTHSDEHTSEVEEPGESKSTFVRGRALDEEDLIHSGNLDDSLNAMNEDRMTCEDGKAHKRIALAGLSKRWPNGLVPYTIEKDFTEEQRALVSKAINQIMNESCVVFREKQEGDVNWMEIATKEATSKGLGCNALLGFPGTNYGASRLNLESPGCMRVGTVIHEIFHILGFKHEHVRPDRDNYVTLRWSNIKVSRASNYWRAAWETENITSVPVCSTQGLTSLTSDFSGCRSPSLVKDFGVGYDYKSIMHYGFTTTDTNFVVNTSVDVMTPFDTSALSLVPAVGRATKMSANDVLRLKAAYSCSGCGGHIRGNSGTLDGTKASTCEWIINTETNRGINITFTNFQFSGDCSKDYLEIRYGDSKEGTLIGKYCSTNPAPAQIVTKSSRLWVYSVKSSGSIDTWSTTWATTEMTCCSTVFLEGITGRYSNMGLYTLVEGKEVAGRPLYKQKSSKTDNYLYYYGESAWFVSDNYTRSLSGIRNKDATYCPEDGATPWQSFEGKESGWVNAKDASCRCSDCSKYPDQPECVTCCTQVTMNSGASVPFGQAWTATEEKANGKIVYKNDAKSEYCLWTSPCGSWVTNLCTEVSSKTKCNSYISSTDSSKCPQTASWSNDIQVKCKADCTKNPTLPECETCCDTVALEGLDGQTSFNALYKKQDTELNGRPIYKQDGQDRYLLFDGAWKGKDTPTAQAGSYIKNEDTAYCPDKITAKWQYPSGGAYVTDEDAKTRCSDCSKYPSAPECVQCCSKVTMNNSAGYPFGQSWTTTGELANGNTVYKNDANTDYCLWTSPCGRWVTHLCTNVPSKTATGCISYIMSQDSSKCPRTASWSNGIQVTCDISCSSNPPSTPAGAVSNWDGSSFSGGTIVTYTCANGDKLYSKCSAFTASWVPSTMENCPGNTDTSKPTASSVKPTDLSVKPTASSVKPTDPSVKPTEPSVKPTEPSIKPTVASVKPTEPSVKPTEPSVKPTIPSVKPSAPSVKPSAPSVKPTEPSVKPTELSVKPTEPSVKPTEPPVKPTVASVKPTEPSVKPTVPSVKPTEPSVKPTEPSVKPTQPSVKPTQLSVKPREPSVKPTQPSVKPTEPSVKPTDPSVKPTEPSVKPTEPSVKPTKPSVKLTESSAKATEPTVKPTVSSIKPTEPTVKPTLPPSTPTDPTMPSPCSAISKTWRMSLSSAEKVWTPGPVMSTPRYDGCTMVFKKMAVITGGRDCFKALVTTEGVSSSGEVSPLGSMNVARYSHGCVAFDDMMMVAGGVGDDGRPLVSVEIYNDGVWTAKLPSLPEPRFNFPMLAHMNIQAALGGASGEQNNNVLVKMSGEWSNKKQFNFTMSQETAVALYPIGLC